MNTYADSNALVALYITEQFSDAADATLKAAGQIPFNVIHQLEVSNAFERLVGRKLLAREECRGLYDHTPPGGFGPSTAGADLSRPGSRVCSGDEAVARTCGEIPRA